MLRKLRNKLSPQAVARGEAPARAEEQVAFPVATAACRLQVYGGQKCASCTYRGGWQCKKVRE